MDAKLVAALTLLVSAIVGIPAFLVLADRRKQRYAEAQLDYNRAIEKTNQAKNVNPARSLDDPLKSDLQQDIVDLLFQCLSKRPNRKDRANAQFQLAHVFSEQGRIREAEERLLQALRLNRRHKDALYDLAIIRKDQGNIAAAKRIFEQLAPFHEGADDWLKSLECEE